MWNKLKQVKLLIFDLYTLYSLSYSVADNTQATNYCNMKKEAYEKVLAKIEYNTDFKKPTCFFFFF